MKGLGKQFHGWSCDSSWEKLFLNGIETSVEVKGSGHSWPAAVFFTAPMLNVRAFGLVIALPEVGSCMVEGYRGSWGRS